MAKGTMDFTQQNTEQAMQATNWMRAIAEQNLNQSRAAFEGLLTIARNAVGGVDQQAAFIRDSMTFAEETLANTFDFAHKLVRMKEPQEFVQIQSEFFNRRHAIIYISISTGFGNQRGCSGLTLIFLIMKGF